MGHLALLLISVILGTFAAIRRLFRFLAGKKTKPSEEEKATNITPASLLEVNVTLPMKVIFVDEITAQKYPLSELAQLPKIRLGEGTLGSLYKVVLNCGGAITLRKIREGLVKPDVLEFWIKFFGGVCNDCLLTIQSSFWYGGEAFVLYEYLCLGSLEELLHGSEGIQFTPLNWRIRQGIALYAAKAVASIHSQVTKKGQALVCGVIKSSNILIRVDFTACLSGYETAYLVSEETIIRRNPGRVAPELVNTTHSPPVFTKKSDVYSFGTLLLELITGKKPTVINLGEYVKEKERTEGWKGIYDRRMEGVKENVADMVGIAQQCLSHNPKQRPPMDRVVQIIQELQE